MKLETYAFKYILKQTYVKQLCSGYSREKNVQKVNFRVEEKEISKIGKKKENLASINIFTVRLIQLNEQRSWLTHA